MARRKPKQTSFKYRTWGGKRRRAGRKPKGERAGVSHRTRPALASRFPVHVTLRVVAELPTLRQQKARVAIERAIRGGSDRFGFRVVHYSILKDHVHLIVEAKDARALSRGMQGLCIRMAKALNRAFERKGGVFADRYHARVLRTPKEVRAALAYVLNNLRRHGRARNHVYARGFLDPFSSARWFDGWRGVRVRPPPDGPVAEGRTWLLRKGWRRYGLLVVEEVPGGAG